MRLPGWRLATGTRLTSQPNLVPFCASVVMTAPPCSASCGPHSSCVLSSSQIVSQVAVGVVSYPFWCFLMIEIMVDFFRIWNIQFSTLLNSVEPIWLYSDFRNI